MFGHGESKGAGCGRVGLPHPESGEFSSSSFKKEGHYQDFLALVG